MNVHTPERQAGESQEQYKARRAASKAAVRTMTKGPTQAPAVNALDTSRFFLGQHTNDKRNKRRAFIKACSGFRQFKRISRAHRAS